MKREQDGAIITQFDYPTCETLGLLKMDFLGLRNLTVLDDALANIEANRGETVVLETSTLDDQPTYELLATRRHPRGLPARRRADASAAALDACPTTSRTSPLCSPSTDPARWAPTRTTTTPIARTAASPSTPIHPELAEPLADILGDTYGVIVYQEQVMAIAQKLAGYTLGQADLLRRAMGKKKKEVLDKEFVPFSDGHARATATPTRRSTRCGTSSSRSPTTPSTRPTPPATGWCPTGPPT